LFKKGKEKKKKKKKKKSETRQQHDTLQSLRWHRTVKKFYDRFSG
jgi:hypothetical protein